MNSFVKFFYSICCLSLLGSCSVPEVKSQKKSYIILASDFLHPKDSILFENFTKQQHIKVKIKHLSTDSILSHFAYYGYNSKFDGVLMYSSYTLNKLSKAHILQPLSIELENVPKGSRSPYNDWMVFGFDPYVLDFGKGQTKLYTYNELTHNFKWEPVLTKEQTAAFFASVIHQFGRNNIHKSMNWLRTMNDHMHWAPNDTLPKANFTLSRHSKARQSKHHFITPNQARLGTFYDGIGIASIKHSRKYVEITQLQQYVLNSYNNQVMTGKLGIFPLEDPKSHSDYKFHNNYPAFFRCTPYEASKEYRDMEKIMNKLDTKFPVEFKNLDFQEKPLIDTTVIVVKPKKI